MPLTFTEKAQEALAARVAPERLIKLVPAVAVMVPPPQLPVKPLGVATTKPAGKVLLNPTPLIEFPGLLLVTLKVKLVDPLRGRDAAPKDADSVGGKPTDTLAVEVLPVPPLVELTVTLLLLAPTVLPVTLTVMVHDPPTDSE
jgi:hypothetical protein